MVKYTRRKLSKICASLSVIPITGCMSWDDTSDTRVKNIDIINRTSDRQTINILIVGSDDVVYWKSIDMEPTLESDESYSSESLQDILSQSGTTCYMSGKTINLGLLGKSMILGT